MTDDAVRDQLLSRINDPAELPKFERLYKLVNRRLDKMDIAKGDVHAVFEVTTTYWKRVFGVEWPKTKA